MRDDTVSFRQFAVSGALLTLSPASRLLPKAALELGGRSCWLAVFPAFGALLLLLLAARALLRGSGGLLAVLETVLGRVPGRAAAVLVSLWLSLYCGFILRSGAERLLSTVYESGTLWFFLLSMAAVALVPALGRVSTAARAAELSMLLLAPILLLLFLFALPEIKPEYLLPVEPWRAGGLAAAALPMLDACTLWVYLGFLGKYRRKGSFRRAAALRWAALAMAAVLFTVLCTAGILGPESAKHQQYPFFVMVSNIRLFNVLERIEPLIVLIWVLTDQALLSLLLLSSAESLRDCFALKSRRVPVLLCGAVMLAAAFVLVGNAFELERLSERVVPIVNLSLTAIGIPLLLAVKKIKKKLRRNRG